MGFQHDAALLVIQATSGNVDVAIGMLLERAE